MTWWWARGTHRCILRAMLDGLTSRGDIVNRIIRTGRIDVRNRIVTELSREKIRDERALWVPVEAESEAEEEEEEDAKGAGEAMDAVEEPDKEVAAVMARVVAQVVAAAVDGEGAPTEGEKEEKEEEKEGEAAAAAASEATGPLPPPPGSCPPVSASPFPCGTRVRISGLTETPELNGSLGVVVGGLSAAGRVRERALQGTLGLICVGGQFCWIRPGTHGLFSYCRCRSRW